MEGGAHTTQEEKITKDGVVYLELSLEGQEGFV